MAPLNGDASTDSPVVTPPLVAGSPVVTPPLATGSPVVTTLLVAGSPVVTALMVAGSPVVILVRPPESDGLGGTSMATLSTGGAESSDVGVTVLVSSIIVSLSGSDGSTLSLVLSSSSSIFTENATGIVLGK